MSASQHPLVREYPQYQERIDRLIEQDKDFRHLYREYQSVDEQVSRIDQHLYPASPEARDAMEHLRQALREELLDMLTTH